MFGIFSAHYSGVENVDGKLLKYGGRKDLKIFSGKNISLMFYILAFAVILNS